ncbi:hypothetical protein BJ875DRAFT_459336 [Amylocarpus encephaloides]|uniref:Uncharacterized protein n=1 Tax=Amylocarpus encephaloides TaxID=45428 RepID=A0A9P8C7S7_9HELO|nr:hypothetical protein BJ875DRAFT_459336 [Amylocarpus encephaloides]
MAIKAIVSTFATLVSLILATLVLLANPTRFLLPDAFILQGDNTSNWELTHHNYTPLYYPTTCTGWMSRDASHLYDHDEVCQKRGGGHSYVGTGYGSQAHTNEPLDMNIDLLSPFATLVLWMMCASALVIAQSVFNFSNSSPSPSLQCWNQPLLTILSTASTLSCSYLTLHLTHAKLSFQFFLTSSLLIWNLMMDNGGPLQATCLQCGWPQPQFITITWALLAFSGAAMIIEWISLWTWWRRNRTGKRHSALPLHNDIRNLILPVPTTVESSNV